MNFSETNLTAFLDSFKEEYRIPGYDCSVWHHGKEIFRCQKGFADVENQLPFSKDTLIHIYSNTKVIACVAALQLFEKGLFRLEDPISMYFPEMKAMQVEAEGAVAPAQREITIRDLFTMTAGIGDGNDYSEMGMQFYAETDGACPITELPRFLARTSLKFHPGTNFCYGICHEVLAALIVKLTDEGFGDYLKRHIFEPLGMTNTAFDPSGCASKELANQYKLEGGELKNLGNSNILIPPILRESASGGLISTVDDYMKFQQALCKQELLLKKETIDLMRTNKLTKAELNGYGYTQFGIGYGLGVRTVFDEARTDKIGAFGWGGAAGTYGLIDPENELTVFYAQQFFGTRDIQGSGEIERIVNSALNIQP